MPTVNLGRIKPIYRGAYTAVYAYKPLDSLQYNGVMYQCIADSTGNLPTSTTYFQPMVDMSTWSSELPAAGKLPLAGSNGRLDPAWLQKKPDVKPCISVDWTLKPTAASLVASGWTISRASEMTYFGQAPVKSSENLLTYSKDFGNAAWVKTRMTTSSVTDESGLVGVSVVPTAELNPHHFYQTATDTNLGANTNYRLRFLVKAAGYTKVFIHDPSIARAGALFDIGTGVIIGSGYGAGYVSHSITAHVLGGGLYWCELVLNSSTGGTNWNVSCVGIPDTYVPLNAGTASFLGNGVSGIEVYAAQLQQGFDGPYVETTSTAVTNYELPLMTAAANELAYQHNASGECIGLLSYPTATNVCLHSQDLSNAVWSTAFTSVTSTKAKWSNSAPVWRVAKTDTTGSRYILQSFGTPSAGSTWSVTVALLGDIWSATTSASIGLNGVENGTWGGASEISAAVLSGPGIIDDAALRNVTGLSYTIPTIVRITRTYPLAETGARTFRIYPEASSSVRLGAAILATRVQIEQGPRATPYIPTTSASVTRAAQTTLLGGSAFSAVNNPSQGTLLVRASVEDAVFAGSQFLLQVQNGTSTDNSKNRNGVATNAATNLLQSYTLKHSAYQATDPNIGTISTTPTTAAYSYAKNSFTPACSGVVDVTDTAGEVPVVDNFVVAGNVSNPTDTFSGLIQKSELYPSAMTSAELAAITI